MPVVTVVHRFEWHVVARRRLPLGRRRRRSSCSCSAVGAVCGGWAVVHIGDSICDEAGPAPAQGVLPMERRCFSVLPGGRRPGAAPRTAVVAAVSEETSSLRPARWSGRPGGLSASFGQDYAVERGPGPRQRCLVALREGSPCSSCFSSSSWSCSDSDSSTPSGGWPQLFSSSVSCTTAAVAPGAGPVAAVPSTGIIGITGIAGTVRTAGIAGTRGSAGAAGNAGTAKITGNRWGGLASRRANGFRPRPDTLTVLRGTHHASDDHDS